MQMVVSEGLEELIAVEIDNACILFLGCPFRKVGNTVFQFGCCEHEYIERKVH